MSTEATDPGLPEELLWLLWPTPVRLRARPLEHPGVPNDELGVAWHVVDPSVPEGSSVCAWNPKPIAQSSFARGTAEAFLASAAVGNWRNPCRILLRVRKPADTSRIDEPLRAEVYGALDLAVPEYAQFAALKRLACLLFPSVGTEDAEGDVRVAVMPFSLGAVVRLPQDRKHRPEEWEYEAIELLASLMGGEAMPFRDRILKHATGEI